jgi:hypothetical protein
MTVNPDLEIPETSSQPLSNNTVSLLQPATLQDGLTPCLVTVPLISKQGSIFYYYTPGFAQIFQRVLSLLPAEQLDLRPFLITDPFGDWNNPYDFGSTNSDTSINAWGNALDDLEELLFFSDPFPEGNNDDHLVGMVHSQALAPASALAGIAHRPGHAVVVDMDPSFGRGHSVQGGMITAHELGHNYGRRHIDCGSFPPDQANFDLVTYPCSLNNPDTNPPASTYGYDPIDNVAVPPYAAADLMTYSSPGWVSAYNWDSNLGLTPLSNVQPHPRLGGDAPKPTPKLEGLVMLVTGNINFQVPAASLGVFYILPESEVPPAVLAQSRIESDQADGLSNSVYVVFLDAGGNPLTSVALAVVDTEGNDSTMTYFGQYVDAPPGASKIELIQGTQVLAERFISPDGPTVTVNAPVIDPVAGTLNLSWSANDPDGDPLVFTIQYSADNGATWRAVRGNDPNLEITFGTALLPGGSQCLLRVIASDGANTATAVTSPFAIPLQPPLPFIEGVNEHQRLNYGVEPALLGIALDAQNGSQSNQLSWTVSGPTSFTSIADPLSLVRLSPGSYTATLAATDNAGLTGSATRDFAVLPPTIPDGVESSFDGLGDSDGYTNATYIPLPLEDGSLASIRVFQAAGQLYVGFYNLKFGRGAPRSIGLLSDPTAAPLATPGTNDFGFFVDENGSPLEEQGNGTNLVPTTTPLPGFATAIYRGSNAWSAEFSIPVSQLGGWGHLAAVAFVHGPVQWPPNAATNQPHTWAPVFLGTNPPAGSNQPPVANAGSGFSANLAVPQTFSLDGSASYDPDGDPLTYAWTQTGGPAVALAGASTATPSFSVTPVTSATVLTFQLIVNDGSANSAPSQVQITVLPPLAAPPVSQPRAGATLLGSGVLDLQLVGAPAQLYQIQTSSNLLSWVNLGAVYSDYTGRIVYDEAVDLTNYPVRFYRAAAQ